MDDGRAMTTRKPGPGIISALGLFAALAGISGLAGCFSEPERNAGVDDFPNSIYASVNGFLRENDKAGGLGAPPADSLIARVKVEGPALPKAAAGASASLPPAVKFPRLAKLSARAEAGCAVKITVSGQEKVVGNRATQETLVFCADSAWSDTAKDARHLASLKSVTRDLVTGRVETGEFSDADGDGILNSVPGGESKALVRFTVEDGGVIEETRVVIGDGPDDDFDEDGDNPTYELSWSRTIAAGGSIIVAGDALAAGDTLASAAIADADSDGVAIDPLSPCMVDVTWFARGPTEDDPDVVWSRFRMRAMAYDGKVRTSHPLRFSAESETRFGGRNSIRRLNRIRLLNLEGGEDLADGDTVLARFRAQGTAPSDTLDTLETTLRMQIGDFGDKRDDSVYAIHVRVAKKLGEERSASFDFLSSRPIPHGHDPAYGSLAMRADYSDGTAIDVEGFITTEFLDVTAELRDGKRVRAIWDRSGKEIKLEVLD